ncbi:hypothetical protein DYGSA30_29570 [Dyella sp. GSA-30]|nr:hypothetical protein DYGSA30_29570 [Dyella sp. GSA-30]
MRPAADTQMVGRSWDIQLIEKHIRHVGVVVLTGMHQDLLYMLAVPGKRTRDNGGLDELWPGADDGYDLHTLTPASTSDSSPTTWR